MSTMAADRRDVFPLPALVGAEEMVLGLVLAAVDPRIGGVLLRGEKGSAKTTAARGLSALLGSAAPFVELPLGATEDRVVGALDLRAVLHDGEHRFLPGLLAQAHGGVLYVDEINLLPDHLVDLLLDVAVSGVNRVEREGISHEHSSRFVLVGSMNPEEGELRPQLLDRFGLSVEVRAPADPATRAEAVRRRLAFDAEPERFRASWAAAEEAMRQRFARSEPVPLEPGVDVQVSELCARAGVQGLRADLVICRAACALAGWEGLPRAGSAQVRAVAPLALGHRRSGPWDGVGVDRNELEALMDEVFAEPPGGGGGAGDHDSSGEGPRSEELASAGQSLTKPQGPGSAYSKSSPGRSRAGHSESLPARAGPDEAVQPPRGADPWESSQPGPSRANGPKELPGIPPSLFASRSTAGDRRAGSRASGTQHGGATPKGWGRQVRAVAVPEGHPGASSMGTVDPAATVTAALARRALEGKPIVHPVRVEVDDLRIGVREERVGRLVVMVVDASGSMGAPERVEAARVATLALLADAYQRRDRVAVVTFRGHGAEVVLRPTGSTEVAVARLGSVPIGGTTPLGEGIKAGLELARSGRTRGYRPLLVVISDGRATWAPEGLDPLRTALSSADLVRRAGIEALVLDCEQGSQPLGLAAQLAEALGARHLPVATLSGDLVTRLIQASLEDDENRP